MRPMLSTSSGVELGRLLAPRHGPGVCPHCLNLTAEPSGLCRACRAGEQRLAAVLPISYSVGGEWLHRLIAGYKRDADPWVPEAAATLARICERFIRAHESCLAAAAGVGSFDLVCTVPSSSVMRDVRHPLRRVVGELTEATRDRYARLLVPAQAAGVGVGASVPRRFDAGRYRTTRRLRGEAVLLIDDMWTSGASAESAGAALLGAGAGTVAAIVIARHLNRGWDLNDLRLRACAARGFGYERCALCEGGERPA